MYHFMERVLSSFVIWTTQKPDDYDDDDDSQNIV